MLETNIRIVHPGHTLYVWVRRATVAGTSLTPDLLQRACGRLRYQHGLAAIPVAGDQPTLLAASDKPIQPIRLVGEDWELDLADSGEPGIRLTLANRAGRELLPQLVERALLAHLARHTKLWTVDSPRIWYEAEPCTESEGVAAYRRYEVAAVLVDEIGVGVAVDVGTAFFTVDNLAYIFDQTVSATEHERRAAQFAELTSRQRGQKGTLLYNNGRSRVKCYFESAPEGITCSTTGRIRAKGRSYDSLLSYYQQEFPELIIGKDAPALRVSFRNVDRPQWVAAELVRARVMNDDVPECLGSIDKIEPAVRRVLIQGFWASLGPRPFGKVAPGLREGFWRPDAARTAQLPPPVLVFGEGRQLPGPTTHSIVAHRDNYRQRLEYLGEAGCYAVPPTMTRSIHCAYPRCLEKASRQLAADLAERIAYLTRCSVDTTLVPYDSIADAIEKLRAVASGSVVLFVLNEEPEAYHEVAFQLGDWRVKRVTERTLLQQYKNLTKGAWDRRTNSLSPQLGKGRWEGFIGLNALDVLQQLDVVPFRLDQAGPYEAQLVIDVGHDRRHSALSLLIARNQDKAPSFLLISHVFPKPDDQHEAINARLLTDQIVSIFSEAMRGRCEPLASLLVFRDGRFCGQEPSAVDRAVEMLIQMGKVSADALVDMVDLHKDTTKNLRIWDVDATGRVDNPLEGKLVELGKDMILVATTGAATLHQGTAEPLLVMGNGRCSSVMDAARAVFDGAQLNWSSPIVAQRLPLPLKRTDDELMARAAQEIRRLR